MNAWSIHLSHVRRDLADRRQQVDADVAERQRHRKPPRSSPGRAAQRSGLSPSAYRRGGGAAGRGASGRGRGRGGRPAQAGKSGKGSTSAQPCVQRCNHCQSSYSWQVKVSGGRFRSGHYCKGYGKVKFFVLGARMASCRHVGPCVEMVDDPEGLLVGESDGSFYTSVFFSLGFRLATRGSGASRACGGAGGWNLDTGDALASSAVASAASAAASTFTASSTDPLGGGGGGGGYSTDYATDYPTYPSSYGGSCGGLGDADEDPQNSMGGSMGDSGYGGREGGQESERHNLYDDGAEGGDAGGVCDGDGDYAPPDEEEDKKRKRRSGGRPSRASRAVRPRAMKQEESIQGRPWQHCIHCGQTKQWKLQRNSRSGHSCKTFG